MDITSFTLTYPKKLLVFASHQLIYYEYDEIKDSNICDEYPCIKVNSYNLGTIFKRIELFHYDSSLFSQNLG